MELFFASLPGALADQEPDIPKGVTEPSHSMLALQPLVFYICVAIVFVVFGAILYSVFSFRRSRGTESAVFHHSIGAEIIWTVIPFVILIGMAIPAAKVIIGIEDVGQPDMPVTRPDEDAATGGPETFEELMARGTDLYRTTCAACHQNNGQGMPPTFPSLVGGALTTGDRDMHIDIVVNGKPDTAMLGFASTLSDAEIAAIITFERNAWDNDTGDVIHAADIAAVR